MKQATKKPIPVNGPIWWIDPTDKETFAIDSGEFRGKIRIFISSIARKNSNVRASFFLRRIFTR